MMATKKQPTLKALHADLPAAFDDDAPTPAELVNIVRIELDLIEEGQEAAEHYTQADVAKIRRFLKKWGYLHA